MDPFPHTRDIADFDIFRGFEAAVIDQIYRASTLRELDTGDTLITPGTRNDKLFLLLSGKLEVVLEKDDSRLSIPIQPGECLGEMSLVMNRPTSALARAEMPSRVLLIPGELVWQTIMATRQGFRNLMDIMSQRLQRTNFALIRKVEEQLKYQHLERELESAGKIQASMVPDGSRLFPNRPEVEAFGLIAQAREVGGDFFDALALDQEHLYFAIGDVSGKGMPASLLMARTFTSLRHTVSDSTGFEGVFPAVNRQLVRNNEDLMFVSVFGGVLNVRTGLLRYYNGGHNPPFLAQAGAAYRPMTLPMGTLLGVLEDGGYEMAELRLRSGDSLVLYTDGVTEATRGDGSMFGEDRALRYLNQTKQKGMEPLVKGLEQHINQFVGGAPQADDLTILAIQYRGEN